MPKANNRISSARLKALGLPRRTLRYEEHATQVSFFNALYAYYGKYPHWASIFACPNAARRSPQLGKRMKDEGMRAGVPDIIVPFARSGYHALFIEMKTVRNSPSLAQQEMIALLLKSNNAVIVCTSASDALDALLEYEKNEFNRERLYVKFKRRKK